MSETTASGAVTTTATPSSTTHSPAKNKLAIIIVAAIGGILFIVALILIIVPLSRRRASRRKNKQVEGSSSSDITSTTLNSSQPEVHNRTLSADASVPLLEPDFNTSGPEYSRFGTLSVLTTAQPDAYTQSSPLSTSSPSSSYHSPRLFAPTFTSFTARPPLPDSEPRLPSRSRFVRSAPQQPLRHTRTRIARVPMDSLPEDLAMGTSPPRSPSPIATSTGAPSPAPARPRPRPRPRSPSPTHASPRAAAAPSPPPTSPSPTNWLHIPKTGGIPLISAFRQSISSDASKGSSLPTMQHYPSFTQSQNALSGSGASTRSSQTFYSAASARPSAGHGGGGDGGPPSPPPALPPLPSEYGELPLPRPLVPRLKPGGGGERVPQVNLNVPDEGLHHPASRQASMVEAAQNPGTAKKAIVPGSLRPGEKSRPVSSTVGSESSLSMYVDARSQVGGVLGDDGRWNGGGSVGGSSARGGRQKS